MAYGMFFKAVESNKDSIYYTSCHGEGISVTINIAQVMEGNLFTLTWNDYRLH